MPRLTSALFDRNVFVNCPFDEDYQPLFRALCFAAYDSGFLPRCSLEVSDSSANRLESIMRIIEDCRYAIHDISRTELDGVHSLPRFNMPLELGIYLGCKRFGGKRQKTKSCLILDKEPYRYQKFLSDIAGQDIQSHQNSETSLIRCVRNWLRTESRRTDVPGGQAIADRYTVFQSDFKTICKNLLIEGHSLPFADLAHVITYWLERNSLRPGGRSS